MVLQHHFELLALKLMVVFPVVCMLQLTGDETSEETAFHITSNYYCISNDKGFSTQFQSAHTRLFCFHVYDGFYAVLETNEKNNRYFDWNEKKWKMFVYIQYFGTRCAWCYFTCLKWYWRLICKLRNSDYLIKGFIYFFFWGVKKTKPKLKQREFLLQIDKMCVPFSVMN